MCEKTCFGGCPLILTFFKKSVLEKHENKQLLWYIYINRMFASILSSTNKTSTDMKMGCKKKRSMARLSGLVFPPARANRLLKVYTKKSRIGKTSGVYVAAVLEYLTAEVVEMAGNCCKEFKKKLITPRHLTLAIRSDDELNTFLGKDVTIPGGGVLPQIHKKLLCKKSISKKSTTKNVNDEYNFEDKEENAATTKRKTSPEAMDSHKRQKTKNKEKNKSNKVKVSKKSKKSKKSLDTTTNDEHEHTRATTTPEAQDITADDQNTDENQLEMEISAPQENKTKDKTDKNDENDDKDDDKDEVIGSTSVEEESNDNRRTSGETDKDKTSKQKQKDDKEDSEDSEDSDDEDEEDEEDEEFNSLIG